MNEDILDKSAEELVCILNGQDELQHQFFEALHPVFEAAGPASLPLSIMKAAAALMQMAARSLTRLGQSDDTIRALFEICLKMTHGFSQEELVQTSKLAAQDVRNMRRKQSTDPNMH